MNISFQINVLEVTVFRLVQALHGTKAWKGIWPASLIKDFIGDGAHLNILL